MQKLYLRTNYIEATNEEDIDLKSQFRIKIFSDPISIRDDGRKLCFATLFNDSNIIENTTHIDLNDGKVTNAIFVQVNQLPQIDSRLTAKLLQCCRRSIIS